MGHLIFFILHLIAFMLGAVLLFVSIPLHLIYANTQRKQAASDGAPTPETHVKCPDCAELVKREARVCKHCGCKLIPQ